MPDNGSPQNQGQTQQQPLPKQLQQLAMNQPPPPDAKQLMQQQPLDEQAQRSLKDVVSKHLRRMRNFRRQFDQRWIQFYRQYLSVRDQQLYPDNTTRRSNTTVPYPYSNVETVVSRHLDAFFSFIPWFDCKGHVMKDDVPSEKMQIVMEKKLALGKLIQAVEAHVRNVAIYGFAALKVDWDFGYDHIVSAQAIYAQQMTPMGPQPIINPMDGQPIVIGYQPVDVKVPRNCPRFTAIDIFDLLIDPDGGYVAQVTERPWSEMKREFEQNPNLYTQEGMKELDEQIRLEEPIDPDSVLVRFAEFWDEINNTRTIITYGEDADAIALKDQRFANRVGAAYQAYRRKVFTRGPIVLYHGENPFMHKRAPILFASYSKLPNELYGIGAIECISNLNESLNKFVNMVADNWNLGINARYAYDTNADIDHVALNNANTPGGKVGVNGDPSKVIMPLPTHTPGPQDYQILETYKGMIEMGSGISDFYAKGMGGSAGNKTATGINSIINESNFRFKMFIRNYEVDVLQPLLRMVAIMIQQFVTTPEEVLITKDSPGVPKYWQVKPEELIGAFDFDLVAANYSENKVVRQRNILAFANLAAQSPFLNEYPALIELAKLFEIRNAERMLKTPQQVAMEQQAQLQQQMEMMMFESMLNTESKARLSQAKPQSGGKDAKTGRPRSPMMPEGKLPGAGLTGAIRSMAQSHGLSGMGLENLSGQ
jgi:hypothetical protein